MKRLLTLYALLLSGLILSDIVYAQKAETRPTAFKQAMEKCLEVTENAVRMAGKVGDVKLTEKYLIRCLEQHDFQVGVPGEAHPRAKQPLPKPPSP